MVESSLSYLYGYWRLFRDFAGQLKAERSKLITRNTLPPFLLAGQSLLEENGTEEEQDRSFKEQTQDFQRRIIRNALRRAKGIQKTAAHSLGIKPTTLNEMIKRLKIDVDDLG